MGPSQGAVSNAWEVTSLNKVEVQQKFEESEDARELVDRVLELAWAD